MKKALLLLFPLFMAASSVYVNCQSTQERAFKITVDGMAIRK